jgi:THO complex subunit 2
MDFTREDEATWERVKLSATALEEDMEKQRKHCIDIQKKVAVSAQDLFPSKDIAIAPVQAFLTHCVYPRCRLSPADAIYCAQFVIFLHNNKTPGFSTMHFIDEFIDAFCGMLYSSTEDEAAAIGILLLEIWKVVSRWRYDTSAFESEVVGFPGSALIQDGGQRHVSRDDFTVLYNKWHAAIGRATLGALDSTEYMHVRASFVILSRIVDAFPTRPKLGQKLFDALVPFQEDTYPLQDIKTAAQAYGILLLNARSNGVWKEEDAAAVKAREDKKKADMAEKLKRREEQLAELNRDTAKINEEIGHEDRDGDRRRGPPPGDVKKVSISKHNLTACRFIY